MFIRRGVWIALIITIVGGASAALAAAADKPNIVFILADDLGQEVLGCYGGTSYHTPNVDALARTGMRFEHCYSMPVCHPTRIALLTGRYPFRLNHPKWGSFPPAEEGSTFAHVMKRAGYATAIAGKWQLTLMKNEPDHPHRLGFGEYCLFGWHEGPRYWQPMIYQNGRVRDDVKDRYGPEVYTDFLIDFMTRNQDRPFIAYYSMALCHDVTDDLPAPVPFGPGKDAYDSYAEMVQNMDRMVGRLVAALDRLKLRDRTLILYIGDNGTPKGSISHVVNGKFKRTPVVSRRGGEMIPGGKGELTDAGTRVPLIANWSGVIPPGQVADDLVDLTDFLPTFADLAGGAALPRGVALDGRSFAPRLRGKTGAGRAWVFAEQGKRSWVRNQRWKLYDDGRLFDVAGDVNEKSPVPVAGQSPDAAAARKMLGAAMRQLRGGG